MEKYEVIWTENAQHDLELVIEHIKLDSVSIAKDVFFEIKDTCEQLNILPMRCRIVPELQSIGIVKYRELIYKRWRIIFKVKDSQVYILILVDSSRNLEDILFQRLLK